MASDAELQAARQRITALEEQLEQRGRLLSAYETFVQHCPGAHAIFDAGMTYIAVTDTYLEDYHADDEESVIGKGHYEVFPDMPQRWRDIHKRVLETGVVERSEMDIFTREDGESIQNRWECRPWFTPAGEVGGVITYTDVLDFEVENAHLAEQLRLIFDESPDVILQLTPDGVITMANFEGSEAVIGQNAIDHVPQAFTVVVQEALQRVCETGDTQEYEVVGVDGRWRKTRLGAIRQGGTVTGIIAIVSDIHERKLAEQARIDSERRYRRMLDALPEVVLRLRTDGVCLDVKPGRGLHVEPEALVGQSIQNTLPESVASNMLDAVQAAVRTAETQVTEYSVQTPDGATLTLEGRSIALDTDEALFIARDVTRSRQAQRERERMQETIIEAQRTALAELSTPIIPIVDHILVMPLIGSIDSLRARDIMRALLQEIGRHRAKIVILDVTGVALIDSGIASHLDKTVEAARLKGARTIITGISDAVAETIVELGIDWSALETLSDLRIGLRVALDHLNIEL